MNIGAETEIREFKKTTGETKEGIISLTSMLNKNGYGTLYFGIKDNGDVIGQLRALMFKKSDADFISKTPGVSQSLSFKMLRTLYAANGLTVNDDSFEENLGLRLDNGEYNLMATLLADKNDISIKVVTFK